MWVCGRRLSVDGMQITHANQDHHGSAVQTVGLTKRFGERTAVEDVSLDVPCGTAYGFLGHNGAGKTTLIRMLLGLTRASSGSATVLGLPVPDQRARALARVGAIVEEPSFYAHLTGYENLKIAAAIRGPQTRYRIESVLDRVGLDKRARDRVGTYSLGMRQRLGVARCLLSDPELLILDEPMNGLDPAGMLEFRSMIKSFVDEGRTVVLSSHLLDEVEKTCDAVAIVDNGRVVSQGSMSSVISRAPVLRVDCSDPQGASAVAWSLPVVSDVDSSADGIVVHLRRGADGRLMAGELNRRLVETDVDVFGLELSRPTLEDRFLEITSTIDANR